MIEVIKFILTRVADPILTRLFRRQPTTESELTKRNFNLVVTDGTGTYAKVKKFKIGTVPFSVHVLQKALLKKSTTVKKINLLEKVKILLGNTGTGI